MNVCLNALLPNYLTQSFNRPFTTPMMGALILAISATAYLVFKLYESQKLNSKKSSYEALQKLSFYSKQSSHYSKKTIENTDPIKFFTHIGENWEDIQNLICNKAALGESGPFRSVCTGDDFAFFEDAKNFPGIYFQIGSFAEMQRRSEVAKTYHRRIPAFADHLLGFCYAPDPFLFDLKPIGEAICSKTHLLSKIKSHGIFLITDLEIISPCKFSKDRPYADSYACFSRYYAIELMKLIDPKAFEKLSDYCIHHEYVQYSGWLSHEPKKAYLDYIQSDFEPKILADVEQCIANIELIDDNYQFDSDKGKIDIIKQATDNFSKKLAAFNLEHSCFNESIQNNLIIKFSECLWEYFRRLVGKFAKRESLKQLARFMYATGYHDIKHMVLSEGNRIVPLNFTKINPEEIEMCRKKGLSKLLAKTSSEFHKIILDNFREDYNSLIKKK